MAVASFERFIENTKSCIYYTETAAFFKRNKKESKK